MVPRTDTPQLEGRETGRKCGKENFEIQKDAEKEYTLGDVDKEVLDNFITQLQGEMEFENDMKLEE